MKYSLVICLLLFSLSSHAAVNKWIDAEGKVHYSDMPPADIKSITMRGNNAPQDLPTAGDVAAPKTYVEREAEWRKTQKTKEEAEQKAAVEQEAASIKQKNCENARSNMTILENSPAIVTYNEKGERSVIDDATRKQKTEEARKAVSEYCN